MSIALLTICGGIQFFGINPVTPFVAHAAPAAPIAPAAAQKIPLGTYYYQANFNEVQSIVNYPHNFPEHQNNWCGVANLQAIVAYAWWEVGKSSQNPYPTQESVASLLNSSAAVSPWGRAVQGYQGPGPAFAADIAADGGTDPRSIAWGLWYATPDPYYDHNYIYTGSYPGGNSVDHATRNFASDYGIDGLNNPISVVVNGGRHLVVVSGVQANGDPSVSPNGVTLYDVLVWDPWYGNTNFGDPTFYNTTGVWQWWPISQWETYPKWWGQTYDTNPQTNGYDPDPQTTPLNWYNVPPLSSHWGGNYTTIEEDSIPPTQYDANTALDNWGNPVPHNGCSGCHYPTVAPGLGHTLE